MPAISEMFYYLWVGIIDMLSGEGAGLLCEDAVLIYRAQNVYPIFLAGEVVVLAVAWRRVHTAGALA